MEEAPPKCEIKPKIGNYYWDSRRKNKDVLACRCKMDKWIVNRRPFASR